ncbi:MAG: peptide chain release factor N(5)-glutamine methyltransferase [Firmicutes bacterium]|nr:peptide chain release factor N(5)-glutamine methyltransferase [Bacillota bacterium]
MISPPLTVLQVLKRTTDYFAQKGIPTPRLDAEVLLAHLLGVERIRLYVEFDRPLAPQELDGYRELVARRARRAPVAYLTGRKEFMGLDLAVTPEVLIPRPETELLVERALAWCRSEVQQKQQMQQPGGDSPGSSSDSSSAGSSALRLADIGTGSGAIAVVLAKNLPESIVYATDISGAALAVASANAEKHGVQSRIKFLAGDLARPLFGEGLEGRLDLLASNPPYVAQRVAGELTPEVARHEPQTAIFGGEDGLKFYPPLVEQAGKLLRPGGLLALEIGHDQASAVGGFIAATGKFEAPMAIKDYAGHDRVVLARKI